MTELSKLKKRIENWSGFPIELDKNNSCSEWISKIDELMDQLTNEVCDDGRGFERQIKELIPDE